MLKVLLVDDEVLVRTHIGMMPIWDSGEFEICGEASNGEEAKAIIEKEQPEIVISDIKMPVMDGLKLSQWLKAVHPQIRIIILSNYDDFDYVKGTLKNGAVDYILKHTLDSNTLLPVLRNAAELIKGQSLRPLTQTETPNRLLALREKFLLQLLTGFFRNEEDVKVQLKLLDIPLDTCNVVPIAMVIDDYYTTIAKGGLKDTFLTDFAILNIIEEILTDMGIGAVCHTGKENYALLLSFAGNASRAHMDNSIRNTLSRIKTCLHKYINITVCFSVGKLCHSILEVSSSYENAGKSFENRFFYEKSCILNSECTPKHNIVLSGISIEQEREILNYLEMEHAGQLLQTIDKIFLFARDNHLSLTSVQMIVNDLLSLINRTCKSKGVELSHIYENAGTSYEQISRQETLSSVKEGIRSVFSALHSFLKVEINSKYSSHVQRALQLIHKDYSRNISLASIADEIGISITYLSKLFKEEVGIGFSEYLCDFRLEKAKTLLTSAELSIADIAARCGFNDYAYFFNVFKKKMGMTPKEYLKKTN